MNIARPLGNSANPPGNPTAAQERRRGRPRWRTGAPCIRGGIAANSPRNRNTRRGSRSRAAGTRPSESRVCGENTADPAGRGRVVPALARRPRRPKRRGVPPRPGKPPPTAVSLPIPGARGEETPPGAPETRSRRMFPPILMKFWWFI